MGSIYIYKGRKFNARKEDVEGENFCGRIYRFYIKCTRCLQEISSKTDPRDADYTIEAGATRNFMSLKLAEEKRLKEVEELKNEEATNPMTLLENRTRQSKLELDGMESLKELNYRHTRVNFDELLQTLEEKKKLEGLEQVEENVILLQSLIRRKRGIKEEELEEVVGDQKKKKWSTSPFDSLIANYQSKSISSSRFGGWKRNVL